VARASIEEVLAALLEARVEFVVVGGVAVVLQGFPRLTVDLDLVVRLEPANVRRALAVLDRLGYRPSLPVAAEQFADPERRATWAREKQMRVFSLWSERLRDSPVDLFVEEPIPFAELAAEAARLPLDDLTVPVASVRHLIQMKTAAGRGLDREDVEALRELLEDSPEKPGA
jgi:hypothetical protein